MRGLPRCIIISGFVTLGLPIPPFVALLTALPKAGDQCVCIPTPYESKDRPDCPPHCIRGKGGGRYQGGESATLTFSEALSRISGP